MAFDLVPIEDTPQPAVAASGGTFDLIPIDDAPSKPQMGTGEDVGRSFLTGVVKGVPNLIDFGASGVATLADEAMQYFGAMPERPVGDVFSGYASQGNVSKGLDKALNTQEHQAQTKLGEYANLAGQGIATAPLMGGATAMNAVRGATGGVGAGLGGDVGEVVGGDAGRVIGTLAGGYYGAGVPDKAIQWLKSAPKQASTPLGSFEGGIDDVGRAKEIQDVLQRQHQKVTANEDKLWANVRKESIESSIRPKQAGGLIDKLVDAQANMTTNDAAGMVDRQIARLNRFIANGQDIPANEIIGIRRNLSKAAQREGGLWQAVKGMDDFIAQNLDVPTLPKAIDASRNRFTTFDDQKAVASAIADEATPETFGRVLFGSSSPANSPRSAEFYNQVIKAAGKGNQQKVQQMLDQTVAHRILQVARQNEGEQVWIGKAANEITNLQKKNPSLWGKLSPEVRDGLKTLETTFRAEGAAGSLNKIGNLALSLVSKSIRPFGISTNLHLPSVIAPKTLTDVKNIVDILGKRPEQAVPFMERAMQTIDKRLPATGGIAGAIQNDQRNRPTLTIPTQPVIKSPAPGEAYIVNEPIDVAPSIEHHVLRKEEDTRPISYIDSTGHKTVGTGFNMDGANARTLWKRAGVKEDFDAVYSGTQQLSPESDTRLLSLMSDAAAKAAPKIVAGFDKLGENQKAAAISLIYQLGGDEAKKLKAFKYLSEGNAKAVENSLLNTKVGREQAPARIKRQALMLAYNIPHEEADRMLVQQGRIKKRESKYL